MRHRFALITTSLVAFTLSASACSGGAITTDPASTAADGLTTTTGTTTTTAIAFTTTDPTDPSDPSDPSDFTDEILDTANLKPGEIPPIPQFTTPSLAEFDEEPAGSFINIKNTIGTHSGLTVTPTSCDDTGHPRPATDTTPANGDESGYHESGSENFINNDDGSGAHNLGATRTINNGDGSGAYSAGSTRITINADGSGVYSAGSMRVVINADGSGVYSAGSGNTINNGDGSGAYYAGAESIINNGDGSGAYYAGAESITNHGNGTATDGDDNVAADPLPPLSPLGKFPPIAARVSMDYCGTIITLESHILSDSGESDLRPESDAVLDSIATALTDFSSSTLEISGHTESIAQAVADALKDRGVTSTIEITEQTGPAAQQANRGVEIFVPEL